eukprot:CAMPEP_0175381266 /NCGR_PEP_ID=MMETSP0095-20121207/26735_2 /TAXON_ID=311494 /ORGANISM="Alexandrium monilatum, Strain CCMP3105" /LENGTH=213 /DNA_ID=CAMNT_0016679641 /DNA_START=365 /DNA_END=1002 /DNA_ORIENTATION=-
MPLSRPSSRTAPASLSMMRRTSSEPPAMTRSPQGEKATAQIAPNPLDGRTSRSRVPSTASTMQQQPQPQPAAMRRPQGEKARDQMLAVSFTLQTASAADLWLQEAEAPIEAAGREVPAVRRTCQSVDTGVDAGTAGLQLLQKIAGVRPEEAEIAVLVPDGDALRGPEKGGRLAQNCGQLWPGRQSPPEPCDHQAEVVALWRAEPASEARVAGL